MKIHYVIDFCINIVKVFSKLFFIRFGIRDRLVRLVIKADDHINYPFVVKRNGLIYEGNLNSYIDWSVYFYGYYERNEIKYFSKLLNKIRNPTMLDIGANVGHHSLFLSPYCSEIIAFEPLIENCVDFEKRMKLNSIRNVRLFKCGLGDKNQKLNFILPGSENKGTGFFSEAFGNNTIELDVRRGDDVLSEIRLEKLELIKMDVEGFEVSVIKGLVNHINKFRPIIFMEFTSEQKNNICSVTELKQLLPNNYNIYLIQERKVVLILFQSNQVKLREISDLLIPGNLMLVPIEKVKLIS